MNSDPSISRERKSAMEQKSPWRAIEDWIKLSGFVFAFLGFWMIAPPLIPVAIAYLLFKKFFLFAPLFALYGAWFMFTRKWPERGCMPWPWFRTHALPMQWAGDYFNYRIVKTAELPTDRNYIVGSHPHGLICLGMYMSFASHTAGITDIYKGLKTWCGTLAAQFLSPFRREILMWGGVGSVDKKGIQWILRQKEKGQAMTITIGGLNEAIVAAPGKYYLKLKDRKGFAKLALSEGADLVPMFQFGENEMYAAAEGICPKRLRNMQARLLKSFGFCPPLLVGRSLLGLPWGGFVPLQTRMESVIGGPIRVEKNPTPTNEEVDQLHQEYCDRLVELFEAHKANYGIKPEQKINGQCEQSTTHTLSNSNTLFMHVLLFFAVAILPCIHGCKRTYIANAFSHPVLAMVDGDRAIVTHASAEFRAEIEIFKLKASAGGSTSEYRQIYYIASSHGFTAINSMQGLFKNSAMTLNSMSKDFPELFFEPKNEGTVYISIFTNDNETMRYLANALALDAGRSVIVNKEGFVRNAADGKRWIDEQGVDHNPALTELQRKHDQIRIDCEKKCGSSSRCICIE